jgi:hypothetical protein
MDTICRIIILIVTKDTARRQIKDSLYRRINIERHNLILCASICHHSVYLHDIGTHKL